MPALAIIFVVAGAFVLRQVFVGRAKDTPTDIKDAATALLNGDTTTLNEVMSRRGSNTAGTDASAVDGSVATSVPALSASGSTALAAECVRLGEAATGYVLGATGPHFYDCSGLVWRACRNLGIFKGNRFTTQTFEHVASQFAVKINSSAGSSTNAQVASTLSGSGPKAGDIVIWVSGGHMGVMVSDTSFYSARSPAKGIGAAPLSADIQYFHSQPDIWRVK